MQFNIKQHNFIKDMRVNIKNRLVQQDLFELLNTHSYDLSVHEEDGKYYLSKVDMDGSKWKSRTLYGYESNEEVLEDLKEIINIMRSLDI